MFTRGNSSGIGRYIAARDGFFFHDLPIAQVLALEANDRPAVKVLEDRRRPSQHPPGGLLDGVALVLPADAVAVVDRPGSQESGKRFASARLGIAASPAYNDWRCSWPFLSIMFLGDRFKSR